MDIVWLLVQYHRVNLNIIQWQLFFMDHGLFSNHLWTCITPCPGPRRSVLYGPTLISNNKTILRFKEKIYWKWKGSLVSCEVKKSFQIYFNKISVTSKMWYLVIFMTIGRSHDDYTQRRQMTWYQNCCTVRLSKRVRSADCDTIYTLSIESIYPYVYNQLSELLSRYGLYYKYYLSQMPF